MKTVRRCLADESTAGAIEYSPIAASNAMTIIAVINNIGVIRPDWLIGEVSFARRIALPPLTTTPLKQTQFPESEYIGHSLSCGHDLCTSSIADDRKRAAGIEVSS